MKSPMSTQSRSSHWIAAIISLCALLVASEGQAAQLHLLIFGEMSDPGIEGSVMRDRNSIYSAFQTNITDAELVVGGDYQTDGPPDGKLTPEWILNSIREQPVRPEDTIVVYFAGHGAFDEQRGQYMSTPGGQLLRSKVVTAMQDRKVRLAVLITDTCSVRLDLTDKQVADVAVVTETSPAFVSLFFERSGLIDMSASSPGEVSMGDDIDGGYFTSSFCRFLRANNEQRLTWTTLRDGVQSKVDDVFSQKQPRGVSNPLNGELQFTQTITAKFDLDGDRSSNPDNPNPKGPRFGVRVVELQGGGLEIKKVEADAPASRCRLQGTQNTGSLEIGDVIVSINGQEMKNEQDFIKAVDSSPRLMQMVVVDHAAGKRLNLETTLAY